MTAPNGTAKQPMHVRAFSSPRYTFREIKFRFLATGQQSGGSDSLMEIASPVGSAPGPHEHEEAEEHFVVLEDKLPFQVGDQEFSADAGDVIHGPRGVTHAFTIRSDPARTLATYTPPGEEVGFVVASVLAES